jgi:hypothetical protein
VVALRSVQTINHVRFVYRTVVNRNAGNYAIVLQLSTLGDDL